MNSSNDSQKIDYTNAASVKVLQVGKPTNVLKQLNMTADQYNWVQSIYFVSKFLLVHNKSLTFQDQLYRLRSPKQPASEKSLAPQLAIPNSTHLGHCLGLSCSSEEQRRVICGSILSWDDGGRYVSWYRCTAMLVVQK